MRSKSYTWWFLLAVVIVILFIPAMNIKFLWIDDGFVFTAAQKVMTSITSINISGLGAILFEEGGRLRTVYWLYQAFVYSLGGDNPVIYFVVHFLVIFVTSIYIFETVKDITKSGFAAFFAGVLYLVIPTNTENLYRLGPQEPILALFITVSLYYLLKSKLKVAVLFLFLATFVKETGFFVVLPVLALYLTKRLFYKKRDLVLERYCIWGGVFFTLVLFNTIFRRSGYSTYYIFNPVQMAQNFISYVISLNRDFSPFLPIFIASAVVRVLLSQRHGKLKQDGPAFMEEGIFLLLLVVLLVIQSPWQFILSRYLMPGTVGLVIFMGIEFEMVRKYVLSFRPAAHLIISAIFTFYFIVFIAANVTGSVMMGERFAYNSNFIQSLFKYLSTNVSKDGTVLYNFDNNINTEEPIIQTGILLRWLYNRPDIKVGYLDMKNLPKAPYYIIGTTIVKEGYDRRDIEKGIIGLQKDPDITRNAEFLVLTTPFNLIKQTLIKTVKSVTGKKLFNPEGVYTYYIAKDYWYIYDSQTPNK